jgi:hypothetical protein
MMMVPNRGNSKGISYLPWSLIEQGLAGKAPQPQSPEFHSNGIVILQESLITRMICENLSRSCLSVGTKSWNRLQRSTKSPDVALSP